MKYISTLPENFPKKLLKSAYSLENIGVKKLAWKHKDAIQVVNILKENNYGILGGDVLRINDMNLCYYTLDNWYCDKQKNDTWSEYVKASSEKAKNYINHYYEKNGNNFCYSISFSSKEHYRDLLRPL